MSALEAKDTLVLRVKFLKTSVFVPCRPTSTLLDVKQQFLSAVQQTKQLLISADAKIYPDWADMDASKDIGLFVAGTTGGDDGALDGMTTFMPLDQGGSGDSITVKQANLKDADAVCAGLRAQGASSISQPVVQFTDHEEEEQLPDTQLPLSP